MCVRLTMYMQVILVKATGVPAILHLRRFWMGLRWLCPLARARATLSAEHGSLDDVTALPLTRSPRPTSRVISDRRIFDENNSHSPVLPERCGAHELCSLKHAFIVMVHSISCFDPALS